MKRPSHTGRRIVATYSDSWFELTYRTFAGVVAALPKRAPSVLVDYGPIPIVPETSADAPPWRGRVHGALVYCSTAADPAAFAAWLRRGEVPTVVMVSALIDSGLPIVCIDYREIGRVAARHLAIDCGCQSFLHVGKRNSMATGRREEGFRDALAALGHEMQSCRADYNPMAEDREIKPCDDFRIDALLLGLGRPIGLFATTDALAAAVVATCSRLGLRVPQDVAVLGIDNTMLAHTHSPSISSIRVQSAEVGATAIRLLDDLMRGGAPPREPVLIGGCEIYARTSTVGPQERGTVLTVDVAMERIRDAACMGLTVDRLAEVLGVSRRTLVNVFRRERDTTPNEEIQRVRFETAARMLRCTNHSVAQITALTGFSSEPAFYRFFRRMIGMTPLEYRHGHGPG